MSDRECPVGGCTNSHPRNMMMCKKHWFMVPKLLRDEVWHSYRNDGVLSERYIEARKAAIESVEP